MVVQKDRNMERTGNYTVVLQGKFIVNLFRQRRNIYW